MALDAHDRTPAANEVFESAGLGSAALSTSH